MNTLIGFDIFFVLLVIGGFTLMFYIVKTFSPNTVDINNSIIQQKQEDESTHYINIKNESIPMDIPITMFILFGLFIITLFFRKSENGSGTEKLSIDSLLHNIPLLTLFVVSIIPFIYFTYDYYKHNVTHGNDPKASGFLFEGFVFAFLTMIGDNLALFIEHEHVSALTMLASFTLFLGVHILFEKIGFNKWFFPVDIEDKKCAFDGTSVDLTKCKKYEDQLDIETQVRGGQYFVMFLLSIVFMVFVLPSIKYFQDRNSDFKITNAFEALSGSLIVAILTNIAMQFMYYRRNDHTMKNNEMMLVGGKFMIHHLLWNLTRINKVLT
jgi:hypothetical protein